MSGRVFITAVAMFGVLTLARAQAQPVAWTQRIVSGPSARYNHAMAYDSARAVAVLFGGSNDVGDTWEWNGTIWTRRSVSGPSARSQHAMAYDAARGVTVLFGGNLSAGGFSDETWEWNGTAWTHRFVSGPSARYGHAMVYDAARGVTVLFGGFSAGSGYSGETWEWNGTAWTQRTVSGPAPRSGHAMAYDAGRGVTVLFGGILTAETWEYNGIAWNQLVVSGPTPRNVHAMTYDAPRGVTVLFGGYNGSGGGSGFNAETWEWNGIEWTQRVISGPTARASHAMVYDAARAVTVLFGGVTGMFATPNGETWELQATCAAPSITIQPVSQTVCPGSPASFTVTAAGEGQISYQWRRGVMNLTDEPDHISGSNAPTLLILNATESDEGTYTCIVSNACGNATSDGAMLDISPADFNRDGVINSDDFFNYLACFFNPQICAPPLTADFNHDGTINSQDYFDFLTAFFARC